MPPSEHVFPAHLNQPTAAYTQASNPSFGEPPPSERMSAHVGMSRNDDNTAAGMALSQEESMYLTPAASPDAFMSENKENLHPVQDEGKPDDDIVKHALNSDETVAQNVSVSPPSSVRNFALQSVPRAPARDENCTSQRPWEMRTKMDESAHLKTAFTGTSSPAVVTPEKSAVTSSPIPRGLAKVDLEMDLSSNVRSWDFSNRIPSSRTPSAMLQPCAKYVGTQQSGHHTYNVEVTILTVNMEQSSLSGFLKISNLTPEHPVLETFFTGEIVGGPQQRYSFRTMDPAWGTNEKIDMRHWSRFPAWRQFSSIAKRDMSFDYPLNGQAWYQQEHVYMRWKERFLAPDHRKSNLSGASFEGFYYICLNQMEGKISGVYFHTHSEQ